MAYRGDDSGKVRSPHEDSEPYPDADREVAQRMEEEVNTPTTRDPNEPKSLFSLANLKVAQVNIICGTLNGYSIGFVGVYANVYGLSSNCYPYKSRTSCESVPFAKCQWIVDGADQYCGWQGTTCHKQYSDISSCNADPGCTWSYSAGRCQNPFGFDAAENGIFAGAMILGCFFGSFFGGPFTRRLGQKLVFLLMGIAGTISSVMYHIASATDQFWVLCVFRFVIGFFLGMCCVAAPMYVAEHGHPKYVKMIGVMFQVFTAFGIFVAATIGIAVGQSVQFSKDSNPNMVGRLQALCVVSTALSLLVVVLGITLPGSFRQKKPGRRIEERSGGANEDEARLTEGMEKKYGWGQMLPPLLMGIVVAGTLQLTGVNAVMNYAPSIMDNLGTAPLVGNYVIMIWNFVTTCFSIPLASVFTMRQLFLTCSLVTSLMCLFMCGIPVFPGNTKKKEVKNGVAITGILIYITAFEMGVGPCFYVLAQDLFPKSFRATGASSTNAAQFVFNVIINVCYPIATEKLSGGPSGNQDKGQAIAFIFFGCIGLVCFVLQIFFLNPWDDIHPVAVGGPPEPQRLESGHPPDDYHHNDKLLAHEDVKLAAAKPSK